MIFDLPADVKYILNKLNYCGFESFVVGGCVRDMIMGNEPKDYDITTNATPEQMYQVFDGEKIIPTGEKYGTLTVLLNNVGYEITTYRFDGTYGDGRRPDNVSFGEKLEDDLSRRDFTVNAMAYNPEKGLIDLFGGLEDIKNKIIRTVGNPEDRFNEDGLRILRAIRFATKYNFTLETKTLDAIIKLKHNLERISKERIQSELVRILECLNTDNRKYFDAVIDLIVPEIISCRGCSQNKYHIYDVYNHIVAAVCNSKPSKIVRLALLLHDIGKPNVRSCDENGNIHFYDHAEKSANIALDVLRRLKFDNDTVDKVFKLVYFHNDKIGESKKSVKKLINNIGEDLFEDFIEVKMADAYAHNPDYLQSQLLHLQKIKEIYTDIKNTKECFSLKDLAINGYDVMELGFVGVQIGRVLNKCLEYVLEDNSRNNKQSLCEYVNLLDISKSL